MGNNKQKQQDYIDAVISRCHFFRQSHVWPVSHDLNYEGWLTNFVTLEEKYIACVILTFFNYYSKRMVDKLLYDSIGKACSYFHSRRTDWKYDYFKTKTYYSYIPGETPNISDSGLLFARKARFALNIPENKLIDFSKLQELMSCSTESINLVFIDDIVGSGCQCVDALTEDRFQNGVPLNSIIDSQKHLFAYAPLIANEKGVARIKNKCPLLHLAPAHILNYEYNLFSPDCACWGNNKELYFAGVKLIMNKSTAVGIPDCDQVVSVKGFGAQGLAIAFEHGIPDAVPAFFYFEENGWTPLMRRDYKRIYSNEK